MNIALDFSKVVVNSIYIHNFTLATIFVFLVSRDWMAPQMMTLTFDSNSSTFSAVVSLLLDGELEEDEFLTASLQFAVMVDRVTLRPDMARITIRDSNRELSCT